MIFALSTDDRVLHMFPTEDAAVSYAEGIDVEDGVWLFFNATGNPLEPVFSSPNERGRFSVLSGKYSLVPTLSSNKEGLLELLPEVSGVEGVPPLDDVEAVRKLLTQNSTLTQKRAG